MEHTDIVSDNPYATPKVDPHYDVSLDHLEHNGYVFDDSLIASKDFKPPLICAILGIPINDKEASPTALTVIRRPILPDIIYYVSSWLWFLILLSCLIFEKNLNNSWLFYTFITITFIGFILKLLLTRPCKIDFYFSEKYHRKRKKKLLVFYGLAGFFICGGIYYYHHPVLFFISIFGGVISCLALLTKAERISTNILDNGFYEIHGIHSNLLDKLPPFPLTDKPVD